MKQYTLIVEDFLVGKQKDIVHYVAQGNKRSSDITSEETLKALSENILVFLRNEIRKMQLQCTGYRIDNVPGYGYVRCFAMYSKADKDYELSALAFCDKGMPVE